MRMKIQWMLRRLWSKVVVNDISNFTPFPSPSNRVVEGKEVQEEEHGEENEPAAVDNGDVLDAKGIEQGQQPPPPEIAKPLRRSTKEHMPFSAYLNSEYVLPIDKGKLASYQKVQSHKDRDNQMWAMQDEMNSLQRTVG